MEMLLTYLAPLAFALMFWANGWGLEGLKQAIANLKVSRPSSYDGREAKKVRVAKLEIRLALLEMVQAEFFTSRGMVAIYIAAYCWAVTGATLTPAGIGWPLFAGFVFAVAKYCYDKGHLLWMMDKLKSSQHVEKTHSVVLGLRIPKPAYALCQTMLRLLPINRDVKYGIAAGLPYAVMLAPFGMPPLPLLYGVVYRYIVKYDGHGRLIMGALMGATFVIG